MVIKKDGICYVITELGNKWKIKNDNGGKLVVSYDVPKTLCKTESELQQYILANNLF